MASIKHKKHTNIPDWTQSDVDALIAQGFIPPGKTTADVGLNTDWNDEHDITGLIETVVEGTGIDVDATDPANPIISTTVTQYTTEQAQDAIGTMVDATLVYDDATPALKRAAISGDITIAAGSNTAAIASAVIVNADINASAAIAATKIADGTVSSTEFQYINSLTSNAQTQLDAKQALDSDLTTIAGLTATTDNFIQSKSSAWASRTIAQVKTDLGLPAFPFIQEVWISSTAPTATGNGSEALPYNGSTRALFDALLGTGGSIQDDNTLVHLGPGTFYTNQTYFREGLILQGAGMNLTTIKFPDGRATTQAVWKVLGTSSAPYYNYVSVRDLTIDCNRDNQPVYTWSPTYTYGQSTAGSATYTSASADFTVTIASPGVFTSVGHGLTAGTIIRFLTDDDLPTGIIVSKDYYVIAAGLTADDFQVSTTSGGSAVNTSGDQSGTHTWSAAFALGDVTGEVTGTNIPNEYSDDDGVTTIDSTTFTSASAPFTAYSVGRAIESDNLPTDTVIATYVSATEVTLSQAAIRTGTADYILPRTTIIGTTDHTITLSNKATGTGTGLSFTMVNRGLGASTLYGIKVLANNADIINVRCLGAWANPGEGFPMAVLHEDTSDPTDRIVYDGVEVIDPKGYLTCMSISNNSYSDIYVANYSTEMKNCYAQNHLGGSCFGLGFLVRNAKYHDNYCYNCTTGMTMDTGSMFNPRIYNNRFIRVAAGINMLNGAGVYDNYAIYDNYFEIKPTSTRSAIRNTGGAATIKNMQIYGNTIYQRGTTSAIGLKSDATGVVRDNTIYEEVATNLSACTGIKVFGNTDFDGNPISLGRTTLVESPFVTLTDGATVTITCDVHKNIQTNVITLGGNRTLAISGATTGMTGKLKVVQDSTGSRTLTLPVNSVVENSGDGIMVLTTTAAAVDLLSWIYDGSDFLWSKSATMTPLFDADADDWRTRVIANSGTVSTSTYNAVTRFVLLLKANSLWTKILRMNLFAGTQLAACVVPLKVGGGSATETAVNFVEGDYVEKNTSNVSPAGSTFTVTIASPGVFTLASHGLVAGNKVNLKTTGALPTGLAIKTDYFVISAGLTADAFEVSATSGGAAINTSGSQSGVHTIYFSTGLKGNGTNKYINTGYKAFTHGALTVDSMHVSVYTQDTEATGTSRHLIGVSSASSSNVTGLGWYSAGSREVAYVGVATSTSYSPNSVGGAKQGHLMVSVIDSGRVQYYYVNGVDTGTPSAATGNLQDANIFVFNLSNNGSPTSYTKDRYIRGYTIGSGLTAAEADTYFDIMQTFQTALGRQV